MKMEGCQRAKKTGEEPDSSLFCVCRPPRNGHLSSLPYIQEGGGRDIVDKRRKTLENKRNGMSGRRCDCWESYA